jgi:hypothetical protein
VNANRHHSDHTAEAHIDRCAEFRAKEKLARAKVIAGLPQKLTSSDPPDEFDMREAHANVMSAPNRESPTVTFFLKKKSSSAF